MSDVVVGSAGSEEERDTVLTWLREYNHRENRAFMERAEAEEAEPLFLVARDSSGEVVGGLLGEVFLSWLKIHIMAVAPERRGHGIGGALLGEAERLARDLNCRHAYVDTMSYQAPAFYLKRGYVEAGLLPDWDSHGHAKHFLIKDL